MKNKEEIKELKDVELTSRQRSILRAAITEEERSVIATKAAVKANKKEPYSYSYFHDVLRGDKRNYFLEFYMKEMFLEILKENAICE